MKAEEVLSSNRNMDGFMRELSHRRLDNVPGSAFRDHPIFYFESGLLFTCCNRTNFYCSISAATDRSCRMQPGCTNSCAHGDPYPKPTSGKMIEVWSDGKWKIDGPWKTEAVTVVNRLLRRIESLDYRKEVKRQIDVLRKKRESKRTIDSLHEAWS